MIIQSQLILLALKALFILIHNVHNTAGWFNKVTAPGVTWPPVCVFVCMRAPCWSTYTGLWVPRRTLCTGSNRLSVLSSSGGRTLTLKMETSLWTTFVSWVSHMIEDSKLKWSLKHIFPCFSHTHSRRLSRFLLSEQLCQHWLTAYYCVCCS